MSLMVRSRSWRCFNPSEKCISAIAASRASNTFPAIIQLHQWEKHKARKDGTDKLLPWGTHTGLCSQSPRRLPVVPVSTLSSSNLLLRTHHAEERSQVIPVPEAIVSDLLSLRIEELAILCEATLGSVEHNWSIRHCAGVEGWS